MFDPSPPILHIARNHPDGLLLAVLYYTGVRRGEALGPKWGDYGFTEDQVHIHRDIDFTGPTAQEGALKTADADRYIPISPELKELQLQRKGPVGEYVFKARNGKPLSQVTFKCIWCRLMLAADCVEWRVKKPNTSRENDILKCISIVSYLGSLPSTGDYCALTLPGHSRWLRRSCPPVPQS